MGFVSEQERQEVQCLSKIYPEINEVLQASENVMSTWAAGFAEAPPAHLRAKILDNLPAQDEPDLSEASTQVKDNSKVISMTQESAPAEKGPQSKTNYWSYAAAIAFLFGALMVWQWQDARQQSVKMNEQLAAQEQTLDAMKADMQSLNTEMENKESLLAVVSDPEVQKIVMGPAKEDMNATAAMYWNKSSRKAYFHRLALPAEPSDSQYQLWAIVGGKPQSLGMISLERNVAWQEIGEVEGAQAFAITLEPMGGSESPTLENMMVIGTVG